MSTMVETKFGPFQNTQSIDESLCNKFTVEANKIYTVSTKPDDFDSSIYWFMVYKDLGDPYSLLLSNRSSFDNEVMFMLNENTEVWLSHWKKDGEDSALQIQNNLPNQHQN